MNEKDINIIKRLTQDELNYNEPNADTIYYFMLLRRKRYLQRRGIYTYKYVWNGGKWVEFTDKFKNRPLYGITKKDIILVARGSNLRVITELQELKSVYEQVIGINIIKRMNTEEVFNHKEEDSMNDSILHLN